VAFALVEFGRGLPPERRLLHPVHGVEGPFDAPDLAQCSGQAILTGVGTQPLSIRDVLTVPVRTEAVSRRTSSHYAAINFGSGANLVLIGSYFHAGWAIRARRRSIFPRPYIWRLTSLSLVIWPSVCPLDQGSTMAARTAASSA